MVISFHLFVWASVSFISILEFSEYRSFAVKFIPRYPILLYMGFLISKISLWASRNVMDFCVFILYPATWLSSLVSPSSFLVVSSGFSMYSIMSSANRDSFTSFPICIHFFFFHCCGVLGSLYSLVCVVWPSEGNNLSESVGYFNSHNFNSALRFCGQSTCQNL